ncbi:ankyrin-repeat protein [NY_014 poxvirus]|uniref:ankyrin-repeat protein n=1 Tax=NY_014 poxvirus TaxID=2025360 RepID=UPI000B99F49B|nr:ankyrin-repeat protein [NY_014 poxvirus]AST09425.1 ankyrin-repeat protein [NY_014 poxvirus]
MQQIENLLEECVTNRMNITPKDAEYYLSLYARSDRKNIDVFNYILDISEPSGYYILHIYCGIKGIDKTYIDAIINKGYKVDEKNDDGDYPLHIASKINNNHVIEILLNNGADPNVCNKENKTPLYYLSGDDDDVIDKITLLVDNGIVLNNSVDNEGCGPLLSCIDPSERVFKKMMSLGFESKIVDKFGRNHIQRHIIHCSNPKSSTISMMIDNGISPSKVDTDGNTPLHAICYKSSKHGDIIDILLPFNNVTKNNKYGDTPLTILIKTISQKSIFEKLLSRCKSIDNQLVNICIFYDRCDLLDVIITSGKHITSDDFISAIKTGSLRCVKYLLKNGISNNNALYYAVISEYEMLIDYLLFNRFSVDVSVEGRTCISECVRLNNRIILSKLMLHNPTSKTMYRSLRAIEKDKLDKSIIIPYMAYFVIMRPEFCKIHKYYTYYKNFVIGFVHENVSYEVFSDSDMI